MKNSKYPYIYVQEGQENVFLEMYLGNEKKRTYI